MSNTPENDMNLDLHFLPKWAQQSPDINRYAHFSGEEGADQRRSRRGDRGDSRGPRPSGMGRGGPGGPRTGSGFRGPRPGGGAPDRSGGPGRGAPRGADGPAGGRFSRPGGRGPEEDRRAEPAPAPLLELNTAILPDEKGIDSLARQIKMSGRAYPLFEIAQMILKRPERHTVVLSIKKKADGTIAQPLFSCALDDSLWLSESDAIRYALDNHFGTFYQTEKVPVDAPKGVYTFVAQCGITGTILGPPNHHDYQSQLRKLHSERFQRMPFDAFKARVKIVREETVVKKWVEDQSFKAEYNCLNVAEPLRLASREEVDAHFKQVHAPNLIRPVESVKLSFEATKKLRHPALQRLVRATYDAQRRFPLQVSTHLSQQFASRGLQFFKVNKTVTHVAVARPHHLDLETNVVSDGVKRIVNFINATPGCTRRRLFDVLMPGAIPATPPASAEAPASETAGTPSGEGASPTAKVPLSPELQAFVTDLHWLIHQGHVLEFANGVMETAKKPIAKPVRPAAEKPESPAPAQDAATEAVPTEASLASETPVQMDAEPAQGEPAPEA